MTIKQFKDYPHLLAELDMSKNQNLTYKGNPINVLKLSAGTGKKLDWKCSTCEHEWSSRGYSRVKNGGCPSCANREINNYDGRNCMAITHSSLAKEYQGDANLIIAGTHLRLDWKCSTCEHEWEAKGDNRVQGKGCPACANMQINNYDGRNSMFNTHPELAKEYQGDAKLVFASGKVKFSWKCIACENVWNAVGGNRVNGNGCPACANKLIHSDGRNSMANTHPQLAIEYQGDANLLIAGTNNKLDWKCLIISDNPCEHEWEAQGNSRIRGNGCPACDGWLHSDGRNSMANTHPQLSKEYQGDANLLIAGTDKKLDWKCLIISDNPCGYEWRAAGDSRSHGHGCPACANSGYDPSKVGYVYILHYDDGINNWLKCGITGKPKDRFNQLTRAASRISIEVQPLDIYKFDDGWVAQTCEQELLTTLELRFNSDYDIDGKAEFFKHTALEEIKEIINKYQPNRN